MNIARTILVVVLAIASVASAGAAPGEAASSGRPGSVDRPLQRLAREQPASNVRVLVQGASAVSMAAAVVRTGGQIRKQLGQVASIAAELRADRAAALAA